MKSEAFSRLAKIDPRIDLEQIVRKYGQLPVEAAAQTALWYRIYKAHESQASVEDAHGAYLRFREMTAFLVIILLVGIIGVMGFTRHDLKTDSFLLIFAVEYLVMMLAACNAARHFVMNVFALEGVACADRE